MIPSKRAAVFYLTTCGFLAISVVAGHAARLEDIDINGDGMITEAEFAEYFARGNHRVPEKIAQAAMKKYDLDQSGVVTPDEVIAVGRGDSKGNADATANAPSNQGNGQSADAPGNSAAGRSNEPNNSNGSGNSGGQGGGSGNSGGQGGGNGNSGKNK